MTRMQPEMRKQELIEIAARQFLQQGYEQTSIRSIVKEANGEIGMFYHHFSSKDEIYRAVLKNYNAGYINKVTSLVRDETQASFVDLLERILSDMQSSIFEYASINKGMVNKQMLTILHQNTLVSLKPVFCELLEHYIQRGEISPPEVDTVLLTDFLLYGISAVIHDQSINSMNAKKQAVKVLLCRVLGCENRVV